jgi:hypothetical protein
MNGGQAELHGECGAMSKDSGTLESARVSEMGGDKGNLKKGERVQNWNESRHLLKGQFDKQQLF